MTSITTNPSVDQAAEINLSVLIQNAVVWMEKRRFILQRTPEQFLSAQIRRENARQSVAKVAYSGTPIARKASRISSR